MSRGPKCPECGATESSISRTLPSKDERSISRTRYCPKGHRLNTVERLESGEIDSVLVRRSGDMKLAHGTFDRARLLADVRTGVLKTKRWPENKDVREPVDRAIEALELNLAMIRQPLSKAERQERPHHRFAIMDSDIQEYVEAELRKGSFRLAHVLYALSTTGRRDRGGRVGFESARDVLKWMDSAENYPDLAVDLGPPVPTPVDRWWPSGTAPRPHRVIKRNLQDRHEFGYEQFKRSIAWALVGRPAADETARLIGEWVLWGVAGQQEVLSSQLVSGVLECLRRVDDIAYLRWATVAKNIGKVRDFQAEAIALARHPSPRLAFSVSATPRRPRQLPGTVTTAG